MANISAIGGRIRRREDDVLQVARDLFEEGGYGGLSMDRVADGAGCPKTSVYQWFACKEDVLMALARQAIERRLDMMRRAFAFEGLSRERVIALGEAVGEHGRLMPVDVTVLHIATGAVRQKASPERVAALVLVENQCVGLLRAVIQDAVGRGELPLRDPMTANDLAFGAWSLVDGAYACVESGVPLTAFGMRDPFSSVFRSFNAMADGFGWRPLFAEWDWEETLAKVRRQVFPEEAQRLYGEGHWYGDNA